MTAYQIRKTYSKYFQKSRSFLLPILGLKKDMKYIPLQSYIGWEDIYSVSDEKLILTYKRRDEKQWDDFLLNVLMSNQMFNEYHDIDQDLVAVSFDLNCISSDYKLIVEGKYSKLSKLVKTKIRDYYGYDSPEWAYMETFLYPNRYYSIYSKLLDVEEEHIKFTGELCDPPDLNQETLKIKPDAKINDVNSINLEQVKDIQDDSY